MRYIRQIVPHNKDREETEKSVAEKGKKCFSVSVEEVLVLKKVKVCTVCRTKHRFLIMDEPMTCKIPKWSFLMALFYYVHYDIFNKADRMRPN